MIQTLPGVSSVVSLLPFPIVRGASPASTGFLLDGTRIPLLFHLLAGPSVVHPVFIDEIQFFPGGAPAPYGGYVGGIVDGRTRRARPDERLLDFDINLLQAGGFVRAPIKPLGATVTAAGRYGYPGILLGLATNQVSLSYWDYQLRLDGGTPVKGWTVFFFGANDELKTPAPTTMPNDPNPPLEPSLILGFHRLDLRLNLDAGTASGDVPRRARLRPHVQQRHRLLGVDRRAVDRGDLGPEQQPADRRRRERHVPQPPPGRGGDAHGRPVLRDHVVARNDLRRVGVSGDDLAADARRARPARRARRRLCGRRRPPSPPSIPA